MGREPQPPNQETAVSSPSDAPKNRLAASTSPYLLLHQSNPVDWHPWGEEALAKAKAEDKPIFLSVGYSTCYWCHVMERESFADPETAALLNEHFVSIKVDREERPDVDEIYMNATQLLTGHGGWPNSVFLTPELKPFYAGTYFPPTPRHGLPAFRDVLRGLAEAWRRRRAEVEMQADELMAAIRRFLELRGVAGMVPPASVAERALRGLAARFDDEHGGFGPPPKFPSHANLYLLDAFAADDAEAARMLDVTLDHMLRGGIYDQLGGGFHRYATDREWKIPHFEKMLYDNGHLLAIYARAYGRSGEADYARVVRQTAAFLERELCGEEGGLWSAIDAETDGFEGGYYVWTRAQLEAVLAAEDLAFLAPIFGFDGPPFFEREHYVLHLPQPLAVQAERRRMSRERLSAEIEPLAARLLAARETRPRPLTDDKVLADWNGMAIAGLAQAGRLLEEPGMIAQAERAARFVLDELRPEGGPLCHVWRRGRAHQPAFLSDYAFLVRGLLELAEGGADRRWRDAAEELTEEQIERLGDRQEGGFFTSAAADVMVRSKEIFDGALPSANAVAALNLIDLYRLSGERRWLEKAAGTLRAFAGLAEQQADATRMLALAIKRYQETAAGTAAAPSPPSPAAGEEGPVAVAVECGEAGDGGWIPFTLRLQLAGGWHVYAPEGGGGFPSRLEGEDLELRDVAWPPAVEKELVPGQPPAALYEGRVEITGRARPTGGSPRLVLTYQPCDAGSCLIPERRAVALPA